MDPSVVIYIATSKLIVLVARHIQMKKYTLKVWDRRNRVCILTKEEQRIHSCLKKWFDRSYGLAKIVLKEDLPSK